MSARADKERDLLDGALRVFARDGYSRAGVDALAAEAGVSSRTIYNHHGGKAGLFRAVVLDSAARVADHQVARADELLSGVAESGKVRDALVRFGLEWSRPDPATAEHFAMMRHVDADRAHIDPQVLVAWQEAGPLRVRHALAGHLRRLTVAGLLHVDDPETAALHLVLLTAGAAASSLGAVHDTSSLVRSGVDTFLRAYGKHSAEPE